MKFFPKKEMDELIHGIREWRADEGNSSVHKPMIRRLIGDSMMSSERRTC